MCMDVMDSHQSLLHLDVFQPPLPFEQVPVRLPVGFARIIQVHSSLICYSDKKTPQRGFVIIFDHLNKNRSQVSIGI